MERESESVRVGNTGEGDTEDGRISTSTSLDFQITTMNKICGMSLEDGGKCGRYFSHQGEIKGVYVWIYKVH